VSALSTSALPSELLLKVIASMHSLTRNNSFNKKTSRINTSGQTIQACVDPSTPYAQKDIDACQLVGSQPLEL